jgi:renalase
LYFLVHCLNFNIQNKFVDTDNKGVRPALQSVSYSARFAVGLFYEPGTKLDIPWSAKYVTDNQCIRYISVDDRKRGKSKILII